MTATNNRDSNGRDSSRADELTIHSISKILAANREGFEVQIELLLELGCSWFDTEIGIVAQIEGSNYEVHYSVTPQSVSLPRHTVFSLERTYCSEVLSSGSVVAVEHVAQSRLSQHPAYSDLGLETYIGAMVEVAGQPWGTINFSSATPRSGSFREIHLESIEMFAKWLGGEIERNEDQQRLVAAVSQAQRAESLFRVAIEASPNGMIMVNKQGTITLANREVERLFEYQRGQLVGKQIEILLPRELRTIHRLLRDTFWCNPTSRTMGQGRDLQGKSSSGKLIPVEIGLNPVGIKGQDEPQVLCSVVDISYRKRVEETIRKQADELRDANSALENLAATDALTGVRNRRFFDSDLSARVSASIRSVQPLSLILVDIDDFKTLNDSLGHVAGDAFLRAFAATLVDRARESDIVARFGGDEFALILPDTDRKGASWLAEELCRTVAESALSEKKVTVSVGITTFEPAAEQSEMTTKRLLQEADTALYRAKALGRNRVVHFFDHKAD